MTCMGKMTERIFSSGALRSGLSDWGSLCYSLEFRNRFVSHRGKLKEKHSDPCASLAAVGVSLRKWGGSGVNGEGLEELVCLGASRARGQQLGEACVLGQRPYPSMASCCPMGCCHSLKHSSRWPEGHCSFNTWQQLGNKRVI